MASRNDGIQLLLQAEKSASEKVNEAKRRKAKRLKEAKAEAQAEIEAERAERERHFKICEDKVLGRRSEIESQIQKLTQEIINTQTASVNLHKEDAINMLLNCEYKAELHYRCTKTAQEIANSEQCEINMDVICLVTELVFRFYQVLATDLETFSRHAKRSTITAEDVFCFVRRNPKLLQHLVDYHRNHFEDNKPESPDLVNETSKTKPKQKVSRKKSNMNVTDSSEYNKPEEAAQNV
ncbi:Centromere protein [Schistosoma japonicum]|uniref:Centromere protein S n=1 Tax=Schistosoma japonicum TaxID=6182 RepID=A0A4Z2CP72_SCHJA|nr:Centromere protein [Schistosoma japonicum]